LLGGEITGSGGRAFSFVPERSRVLSMGSHTVLALPAINPDDENSALVTFFQVRKQYFNAGSKLCNVC
jgi:hypothetical protein